MTTGRINQVAALLRPPSRERGRPRNAPTVQSKAPFQSSIAPPHGSGPVRSSPFVPIRHSHSRPMRPRRTTVHAVGARLPASPTSLVCRLPPRLRRAGTVVARDALLSVPAAHPVSVQAPPTAPRSQAGNFSLCRARRPTQRCFQHSGRADGSVGRPSLTWTGSDDHREGEHRQELDPRIVPAGCARPVPPEAGLQSL